MQGQSDRLEHERLCNKHITDQTTAVICWSYYLNMN